MGTVIAPDEMSKTVILTIFRDGLLAAAADVGQPLEDPIELTRPEKSKFVLATIPMREVNYPHIVVSEDNDSAKRLDQRSCLLEHRYNVRALIRAETNTHIYKIRDGVRAWFQENYEQIRLAGFTDGEIIGSRPITWDETSLVKEWQMIFTGLVYTGEV